MDERYFDDLVEMAGQIPRRSPRNRALEALVWRQESGQNIAVLPGCMGIICFVEYFFCDCCGHPMSLSRKKLKNREVDIYLCTHHNRRPDECPKTHIIYHEVLYPYVLEQIRTLARSMKRRKVNSTICRHVDIEELTPEILEEVVAQISV